MASLPVGWCLAEMPSSRTGGNANRDVVAVIRATRKVLDRSAHLLVVRDGG
jgi:hypothetical protein